jgi:hypothetical protein
MVLNATFNNISDISWRSVLLVEENGVPGEKYSCKRVDVFFLIRKHSKVYPHIHLNKGSIFLYNSQWRSTFFIYKGSIFLFNITYSFFITL